MVDTLWRVDYRPCELTCGGILAKVGVLSREAATALALQPPRGCIATVGTSLDSENTFGRFAGWHPRGSFASTHRLPLRLCIEVSGKGTPVCWSFTLWGEWRRTGDRIQLRQRCWDAAFDGWLG
jgi:hypothetical protein